MINEDADGGDALRAALNICLSFAHKVSLTEHILRAQEIASQLKHMHEAEAAGQRGIY